jgi:CDGSH-type Zn-finger protein
MKLTIIENGPIILDTDGQVAVSAGDASEDKPGPLFLCRCGQSATKPFCDGTHRKVSFEGPSAELVVE